MGEIVKDLGALLSKSLGPNETIKDTNYTRLTAPGDNYGSVMLKLDVTIINTQTKEEKLLYLVAKTLPATKEFREIFQIQTTYTNEMAFYDIILPTVQQFQTKIGVKPIDTFAKCYGTRKNLLENSDIINDDAVLLFENLKTQGYSNGDRTLGFDFDATKLLLTDLARFHASFLALKLQTPEIFNTNVRPYCHNFEPVALEDSTAFYTKVFHEVSKEDEDCLKLAPKVKLWGEKLRSQKREPYATVIHTDLWTNNTMQLFNDGKPVMNKFVDFQVFTYGSAAADVFFFLWSSVQKPVLETYLDFLLKFYHDELIKSLKDHKCDISPFSYSKFLDELRLEAGYEFSHSINFFILLSVAKDENTIYGDVTEAIQNAPPHFKEKTWFMVKECNKRGWLY